MLYDDGEMVMAECWMLNDDDGCSCETPWGNKLSAIKTPLALQLFSVLSLKVLNRFDVFQCSLNWKLLFCCVKSFPCWVSINCLPLRQNVLYLLVSKSRNAAFLVRRSDECSLTKRQSDKKEKNEPKYCQWKD